MHVTFHVCTQKRANFVHFSNLIYFMMLAGSAFAFSPPSCLLLFFFLQVSFSHPCVIFSIESLVVSPVSSENKVLSPSKIIINNKVISEDNELFCQIDTGYPRNMEYFTWIWNRCLPIRCKTITC